MKKIISQSYFFRQLYFLWLDVVGIECARDGFQSHFKSHDILFLRTRKEIDLRESLEYVLLTRLEGKFVLQNVLCLQAIQRQESSCKVAFAFVLLPSVHIRYSVQFISIDDYTYVTLFSLRVLKRHECLFPMSEKRVLYNFFLPPELIIN